MKRFRRYIFNTLTVVSLLLMLATVGLWVDSQFFDGETGYASSTWMLRGMSDSGLCALIICHRDEGFASGWQASHSDNVGGGGDLETESSFMGFFWNNELPHANGATCYVLVVPHWFLTLIFAITPAIWLFKWNKRRKLSPNACPACGYDLTGNESGACPECGAATKAEATEA